MLCLASLLVLPYGARSYGSDGRVCNDLPGDGDNHHSLACPAALAYVVARGALLLGDRAGSCGLEWSAASRAPALNGPLGECASGFSYWSLDLGGLERGRACRRPLRAHAIRTRRSCAMVSMVQSHGARVPGCHAC